MTLTEAKLKVVCDWSKPQNIRDIRSFLGFANYYKTFNQELCRCGGPIDGFDQERSTMAVGTISTAGLLATKGCVMHCISIVVSRP